MADAHGSDREALAAALTDGHVELVRGDHLRALADARFTEVLVAPISRGF